MLKEFVLNKLLLWFHSLPKEPDGIIDSLLFEKMSLSAFLLGADSGYSNEIFKGNFNDFISFITQKESYRDVQVLLPANDVLYSTLTVPSKSKSRILQAMPFLLEDSLVKNIDKQYFALGDVKSGQCNVAITNYSIIEKLFQQFKAIALPVSLISSEIFLLPWQENKWSIGFVHNHVVIRTGKQSGVVNQIHNINFSLRLLLKNVLPTEALSELANEEAKVSEEVLFDSDEDNALDDESESESKKTIKLTSAEGLPDVFSIYSEHNSALLDTISVIAEEFSIELEIINTDLVDLSLSNASELLKKGNASQSGINLLQGKYLPSSLKPVKIPFLKSLIVIFMLGLFSQLFLMTYQWKTSHDTLKKFETELEQLYFKTFPGSKRLIDVRTQAQNNLRQLQKNSSSSYSFLNLLALVGDEVRKIKEIKIQSMKYNDGILQLDIVSKGFVFNKIKITLENKHKDLLVEERSSSRVKGEVRSVISFRLKE
ncbi:type II secretion system protein GspL [sulfur-oxidizing endosymbiont of Gigantopelta aegis]|uniref:type II secretion system protein GspL n=1 Tax=sulfur-oxidizing endosymbiont of Gigantopelta aegis TaxID=2794934 RepID=UPI001BE45F92|nr:type II secretion system protein GspL [sulfur-oxidizing endosymbiont of Gigantopelta aegis]